MPIFANSLRVWNSKLTRLMNIVTLKCDPLVHLISHSLSSYGTNNEGNCKYIYMEYKVVINVINASSSISAAGTLLSIEGYEGYGHIPELDDMNAFLGQQFTMTCPEGLSPFRWSVRRFCLLTTFFSEMLNMASRFW